MVKKILFLSVAALAIYSCKSDDDDTSSIVGKWKPYKSMVFSGKTGNAIEEKTYNYSDCEKKDFLEFKSDGKFYTEFYYNSGNECKLDGSSQGTYSYNESTKVLSIVEEGDNSVVKVRELSKSSLVVGIDDEDYDNDGVDDVYVEYYNK